MTDADLPGPVPERSEPVALPAGGAGAVETGDSGPFAALYRETFADMVRLAYLLTGSRETAADLVQDSFVRIQRRWRSIDNPRAYLRRTVVNACRSHHRRRARERDRAQLVADVPVVDLVADEIGDALAALPYRQHAAIVLRYYHDLPEAAIAEVLGCRPGTVASLLHRGLAQLRRVIEP